MIRSLCTVMLAALIAPGVALAASINDKAGLFSKEAVEKAERQIDEIERTQKHDVVIETFAAAEDPERAKGADKADYFRRWARERYKERGVEGVYVLITKSPGRVQVEVGDRTRKHGIDSRAVEQKLTDRFEKKDFDGGLLAAVDHIDEAFASRAGGRPVNAPSASPSAMPDWAGWVCIGLVALMAVWLVVGLLRAFSGGGGGGYGPGYGGGGGFFSSMMGGLFGAAAGMYLYNSMFGSGMSSAYGSGSDPAGGASDENSSGSGGDFGGSDGGDAGGGAGGDFGADEGGGAGGDYGGSDGGAGGDWGGGDAGGGGDWGGGGGGGDW